MIGIFLLAISAITPAMPMPMGASPLVRVPSNPNTRPRISDEAASCITVVVLVAAAFIIQAVMGTTAKAQDDSAVLIKLDEILKGQQTIAKDIEAIKSELNIVKIRVTQIQ